MNKMDLHHLKIFYISCVEQSFTKAAKKLYISQSAVSIQVKKLEESLGVQLIERNSKKFKLTYIGQELYKMSADVFEKVKRMEIELKTLVDNKKNKILIGTTHAIGEPLLPEIITTYKKLNPNIEFDVLIKNQESLLKYLNEGEIDILLLGTYPIEDNNICTIETEDYPFVLVTPPQINNLNELSELYYLKRDDENTPRYITEFIKKMKGRKIQTMTVNGSIETIKHLIRDNMGYSILPYYTVHKELKDNEFKDLYTFKNIEVKFQIVLLKENAEKLYIKEFINFLKTHKILNKKWR